jgi:hypothetical protein
MKINDTLAKQTTRHIPSLTGRSTETDNILYNALVKNKQGQKAKETLTRIGGEEYAAAELKEIEETVAKEDPGMDFRALLKPSMLKILGLGFFVAMLQQWCGMNVTFYYAAVANLCATTRRW